MRNMILSRPFTLKIALLGAVLCAGMGAHAQDKPADFASQTTLTLTGEGPWYRVELPLAAQLSARDPGLGDLRVFNGAGQPQAYALAQQMPSQEQTSTAVKWFPLYTTAEAGDAVPVIRIERSPNGSVIEVQPQSDIEAGEEILRGWLLDASAIDAPLEQLIIDWNTEREGFQHFTIEASDDLQHWRSWGEGQVARLSFSDEVVEQREVGLPGYTARYLRLLWRSPGNAPTLTAAQLLSAPTDSPTLPLTWSPAFAGKSEQPNQYVWQLPVGLPVERVQVSIAQANSLAPGNLYGRMDDGQPWQLISSGLLYRITQNGSDAVQDQLHLSGQVIRQLKLEVDDRGGGLGPQAPEISVAVQATQVVFLARGEGPFTLAVGNARAKPASLPLTTLIPDFVPQRLNNLGIAQPSAAPVADMSAAPVAAGVDGPDFKRIGLWAVLIGGVLMLGWMAFSTWRASASRH